MEEDLLDNTGVSLAVRALETSETGVVLVASNLAEDLIINRQVKSAMWFDT